MSKLWCKPMCFAVAYLLMVAQTLADETPAQAVPKGFIPLPPRQTDGKITPASLKMLPRFIALGPHNFKSVLRASHSEVAHAEHHNAARTMQEAPQEIHNAASSTHTASRVLMSKEQAQQIISIFAPDQ